MAATSAHLKKAAVSETKKKNGKKPFYCDLPQLPAVNRKKTVFPFLFPFWN